MNRVSCECENCSRRICAKRVPIFSGLGDEDLRRISSLITRKRFSRGELVCAEGTPLNSLIIVSEGRIKVFRNTQEGKEQILYVFSSGDFFGEKNLLADQETDYGIEALEETGICAIGKNDFQALLREYPDIGFNIMQELIGRLDRLEKIVEGMGAGSVEKRIGAVLLEFARKYGKPHPSGILVELPLSREGIASYIGLARETVSRKLSLLQDEGVIEMIGNKKIVIRDIEQLKGQ
jgi:CRP-like cAMP-binding protein